MHTPPLRKFQKDRIVISSLGAAVWCGVSMAHLLGFFAAFFCSHHSNASECECVFTLF